MPKEYYRFQSAELGRSSQKTHQFFVCQAAAKMASLIAEEGDLCFCCGDQKLYVRKASGWVEVGGGSGSAAWGSITGTLSGQTDLQATLDGKAASSHVHAISDTTGLQGALDGKSATGHGHSISDVTGLQTALNGKQASPIANADLGSGTADSSTFLRGDRTWATVAGGSSTDPPEGSYAPGSYTIATGKYRSAVKRQQFTSTQRLTIQGTGRLSLSN